MPEYARGGLVGGAVQGGGPTDDRIWFRPDLGYVIPASVVRRISAPWLAKFSADLTRDDEQWETDGGAPRAR